MTPSFTEQEKTIIVNSYSSGWTGNTRVKIAGKCWELNTTKRHSGKISTHCQTVTDEGNGSVSFMMSFASKESPENFYLNELPKGTKATEKAIKEAHMAALVMFNAKKEAGELPILKDEDVIKIGQIVFTDGRGYDEQRRAVYEINGSNYRTVLLDGSDTHHDSHVRPYSEKFGIGTYYNPGESITPEEVQALLAQAVVNMAAAAEVRKIEEAKAAVIAAETKAYLSQFVQADRRQTTNIIKARILKTYPTVSKVEVKSDSFSGGDSMDVTYHAPERIEELDSFINSFQHGHFNSMEDMYEYSREREAIILDGHILQTYKYVSDHWQEGAAPDVAEAAQIKPTTAGTVQIVDYSEKAVAVIGETKAIKDQLKALGGAFNFRLSCGAGWIFSKKKLPELIAMLS